MPDFEDLELSHSPTEPPAVEPSSGADEPGAIEPSNRAKWIVLIVALLAVAGALGYFNLRRSRPVALETNAAPESATSPNGDIPLIAGERIALPALPDTDPLVRDLVVKLSSHPTVLAWLATKGLIENFTVVTLNISEGRSPVTHLRALAPKDRFRVRTSRGGVYLDPAGYRRYDEDAAAVGALDPAGVARLYLTLKPRILDAFRGLGYPDGDFNPVLERAIGRLLAVPVVENDIELREKILSYAFVNPDLESLSAAQKHLLRMGPRNVRIVQAKLREIAANLGLHPDSSVP